MKNVEQIISAITPEWTNPPAATPADKSVDGPLLGNGDMGVVVSGDAKEHRFILCKNDLWRLQHKYEESCPVPFGHLAVAVRGFARASYVVEQDLYSATTIAQLVGRGAALTMESYVAATQNLFVLKISVTGSPVYMRLALRVANGRGSETQTGKTDDIYWGKRSFTDGVDVPSGAAAAMKFIGDQELTPGGSLRVTEEQPVTLVLAMESVFKKANYQESAIRSVSDLSDTSDLSAIRSTHEAWWADYWEKSWVCIGDPIIERQYYLSLYGMGSCSRDPEFPPPIFGWTTTDNPLWAGDYHLNYNHQAPFYGLARANRLEQADPHDTPFLDFRERAAWHCQEMYGFEGGMYPVGIGPKGIETTYDAWPHKLKGAVCVEHDGLFFGQRTNGAYGLVNMAPRWYLTYDQGYGRWIYPFVLQIATFWENYLTWDEEGDRYIIQNDSIHEGSGTDRNGCLAIGLIRNAMLLALDMSVELGVNADRREKWQHILEHLSDYTFQERGGKTVFRYAEEGTDWWAGNTLGIQQIYPAGQIHLDSDPELIEVSKNTIETMQRWLDGNGSNSIFPAAARVGYDPEKLLTHLRVYCEHTRANGFQQDNPHGIENLSTVHNTINEMLCSGHKGTLRLFPCWPEDKDASFHQIRCWGAFLVSAQLTAGTVTDVCIESERGRDCTLVNPWPGKSIQLTRSGVVAEIVSGDRVTFATEPGEKIQASAADE